MLYETDEFQKHSEMLLRCTNQYVFISSARVYADVQDEAITGLEAVFDRSCGERTSMGKISGMKNKIKYLVFRYLLDCVYLKRKKVNHHF